MKRTPDIAEQLRQRLGGAEMAPPEGLWDAIEQQLPTLATGTEPAADKPKTARIVALRRWSIAASLLALVAVGVTLLWQQHNTPQVAYTTPIESNTIPMDSNMASTDNDVPQTTPTLPTAQPVSRSTSPALASNAVPRSTALEPSIASELEPAAPTVSEAPIEAATTEKPATDTPSAAPHATPAPTSPVPSSPIYIPRESPTVSIALYASNNFVQQQNQMNGVRMSDAMAANFVEYNAAKPAPTIYLADISEEEHHNQPLSFGLTAAYALGERWSVTSGLVYTRLQSDFIKHISGSDLLSRQVLHYVGIPVQLSYKLYTWKSLQAYATAGVQADYNVQANITTEGQKRDIGHDRLQLSSQASIGLQYNFASQFSLYAEPGAKYYFDNNSSVSNYFKEHPFAFNLQVGLRWTINE